MITNRGCLGKTGRERPVAETALVRRVLDDGKSVWFLFSNGGKGARTAATAVESNCLYTVDPVTKDEGVLFHLHDLFERVHEAHRILTTSPTSGMPFERKYNDSKGNVRVSFSLLVKYSRSKHFKYEGEPTDAQMA